MKLLISLPLGFCMPKAVTVNARYTFNSYRPSGIKIFSNCHENCMPNFSLVAIPLKHEQQGI